MNVEYDRQADAIYIRLREATIASTREVQDNLILDLDAEGKTIGIELLFVSDELRPEDVERCTCSKVQPGA